MKVKLGSNIMSFYRRVIKFHGRNGYPNLKSLEKWKEKISLIVRHRNKQLYVIENKRNEDWRN